MSSISQDLYGTTLDPFSKNYLHTVEQGEDVEGEDLLGYLVSFRKMSKKSAFFDIRLNGVTIQCFANDEDLVGDLSSLKMGTILEVKGRDFRTRTGQLSRMALEVRQLSEPQHDIPLGKLYGDKKAYQLGDDLKYRHRHIDLLSDPTKINLLHKKSHFIQYIRRFLELEHYVEVETPILQNRHGGAAAKPFMATYHAYNSNVFLRVAPELYLKRLICGGMTRIYEIGKVFRNEGVDATHNPEFTLLEYYRVGISLQGMINQLTAMVKDVSSRLGHREEPLCHDPEVYDMEALVFERAGVQSMDELYSLYSYPQSMKPGIVLNVHFETHIQKTLKGFVYVTGHPIEVSPLSRQDPQTGKALRFELFHDGIEIANGFEELTDPTEQRKRLTEQTEVLGREADHYGLDEDFLYALECGMPPTGGVGVGLDRLFCVITGLSTIRESQTFPYMRPKR